MSPTPDEDLRARRLEVVRRHMQSENELDFATTLATFDHPRYELVATGQVFDGPEEVAGYYRASRAAFPDQRNDDVVLTYGEDAVVAEFDLSGPTSGHSVDSRRPGAPSGAGCARCSCSRPVVTASSASGSTSTRGPSSANSPTTGPRTEPEVGRRLRPGRRPRWWPTSGRICLAFPETTERPFGGHTAPAFRVRDKLFCTATRTVGR